MSDNHSYLNTGDDSRLLLTAKVGILMLRGAGYAAIFCIAMLVLVLGTYVVGLLLPEESKEADDPTPFSYHIQASDTFVA